MSSLRLSQFLRLRQTTSLSLSRPFHLSRPSAAVYSKADITVLNTVLEESKSRNRIVLVDFYADWCGPCHQLSPILEKFASEPNTSSNGLPVDLVKIDTETDDGQELSAKHKVRALPTVVAFKDGKEVNHFIGAYSEAQVKALLDAL